MSRYLAERIAQALVTVWLVTIAIFLLARLSGDPIHLLVPADATQEEVETVRQNLGLDKSWLEQYGLFLQGLSRADFGQSTRFKDSALDLVIERFPATIKLAAASMTITLLVGLTLGILSGLRQESAIDRAAKFIALIGQSVPAFWLGIMLILVFSVQLGWLPTSGYGGIRHMILPAIAASHFSAAALMRLSRSAVLDVAGSDYVRLARMKGLHPTRIVWRHILRNAAIPIVTLTSVQLIGLLNGTVVTEMIFAWPGIGRLMIDSVNARDFPVVQAGVFIFALLFVTGNLLVDISYVLLDPRIKYS